MIVVMSRGSSAENLQRVLDTAEKHGSPAQVSHAEGRAIVVLAESTGRTGLLEALTTISGVERLVPVSTTSHAADHQKTKATADSLFGPGQFTMIAGPCSIEDRSSMLQLATDLYAAGARFFRGGAYKPRTSPYSFQGLGSEGLETLREVRQKTGLHIVTEALDAAHLEEVAEVTDYIQIGSRNMHNTHLLRAAGKMGKPILLKRGMAATLAEWLAAAEYIAASGNEQIVLCERGVRGFSDYSRFTLDLSVIPAIQQRCPFPIVVDPSHATGNRDYVAAMSRAALAAGANGLMVEVHQRPDDAISDAEQAISIESFKEIVSDCGKLAAALDCAITT